MPTRSPNARTHATPPDVTPGAVCARALFMAAAVVCSCALIGVPRLARGETSSWVQRDDPPPRAATPANKPSRHAAAKPDDQPASLPNSSVHTKGFETGPTPKGVIAPPLDKDDAFLAFDQGRYLTALKLAEERAKTGDARAHTLIARIHAEGLGVRKDDALAADWFKRAAELGDVDAQFAYGVILAEGRGVKKDRLAAADMFERAARTGHAAANYNLGMLFIKGDGKPENPVRGAQHITYAAEKGVAQAQYDLAGLYQQGVGVPPNAVETSRWLKAAAAQGMAAAQYDYAVLLLKGLGLRADEPRAVEYMRMAAEKGIPGAQNRLAHIYLEGIGVDPDKAEAAKWRFIAQSNGAGQDKVLDDVVAGLSAKERTRAQAAAERWQLQQATPF